VQTAAVLLRCAIDASTPCGRVSSMTAPAGWVEVAAKSFASEAELLELRDDEQMYRHVVATCPSTGRERWLTRGRFHVTSIDAVHDGLLYLTHTMRGAAYRDLGVVALHGASAELAGDANAAEPDLHAQIGANRTLRRVQCLTCGDDRRTWNSFVFSGNAFVRASDGAGFAPEQTVGSVSCQSGGRHCTLHTARILEDNGPLAEALRGKRISLRRCATFSNDAGQSLQYMMQCPDGASADTPVLVDVYGGPGSQRVLRRFSF